MTNSGRFIVDALYFVLKQCKIESSSHRIKQDGVCCRCLHSGIDGLNVNEPAVAMALTGAEIVAKTTLLDTETVVNTAMIATEIVLKTTLLGIETVVNTVVIATEIVVKIPFLVLRLLKHGSDSY